MIPAAILSLLAGVGSGVAGSPSALPTEIHMAIIPHEAQRYETVGDWWVNGSTLEIRVSESGDWRADMAVAAHELTEALLCIQRGISEESVDHFDTVVAPALGLDEPGDDPRAPYHQEHMAATTVEYQMLQELGMSEGEYERVLERLEQ
jgi:hypothetical protein